MHHYFEAITNTSGASLIGYFARVIDRTTQGTVPIYADDNGTPIITVSGRADMAKTDEYGNLDFYIEPGSYHLDIYAPDATTFRFRVPNVGMNSTKGDTGPAGPPGPAGNVAADLPTLKAADTGNITMIYDQATFTWTLGDYTGQADDQDIVESDNAPLSEGAWVRQGSASVSFTGTGAGVRTRSIQDALRDLPLNPKDYGAIGDGLYHPLSERFSTLAEAQGVYPFATSLSQSLDWAAIQAALNEAARDVNRRGVVRLPVGYYVPSDSLKLPNHVTFEGSATHGSVLHNQGVPLAAPQMVNADPLSCNFVVIRNLISLGGTHTLKISASAESSGLVIDNVYTSGQTVAQIESNILQTSVIRDCAFDGGVNGIVCTGATANSIKVDNVRITNHSGASIKLAGCNGFQMSGGSLEGGGGTANPAIDVINAFALSFNGTYFENVHKNLLKSRTSTGISFTGCTFMGVDLGSGLEAFTFDCDTDLIEFGSNHWFNVTDAPLNVLIFGRNDQLAGNSNLWTSRATRCGQFTSRAIDISTGTTFELVRVSRSSTTNTTSNQQLLNGRLTIGFQGYDAGGVHRTISRVYPVKIDASGNGTVTVAPMSADPDMTQDNTGAITMTVQPKSGATATDAAIECVMTGVNTGFASAVQWTFSYQEQTTQAGNDFQVFAG